MDAVAVGTLTSISLVIIAIMIDRFSLQEGARFLICVNLIENKHRLADWLKKDMRGPVAVVSIVLCVIIAIMLDMLSLQTVAKFLIIGFWYGIVRYFLNWTISIIYIIFGI